MSETYCHERCAAWSWRRPSGGGMGPLGPTMTFTALATDVAETST